MIRVLLFFILTWTGLLVNVELSRAFSIDRSTPFRSQQKQQGDARQHEEAFLTSRRDWFRQATTAVAGTVLFVPTSNARAEQNFTPGGTLVDRSVGVTVGNSEASPSRAPDNSNVLFAQDFYFKFGNAPQFIEPDSTEFPKTMPFTKSQQRYDALKKYRERIESGLAQIQSLEKTTDRSQIADPTASDVYQLRPLGLMANGFLASENTGTTNELFLARWYINEIYLNINDLRTAETNQDAKRALKATKSAANSYLTMMNRVITSKVGDKFEYLK